MIDKASALPILLRKAKALPVDHALDLRTYKRDRSVIIVRSGENRFLVIENGYEKNHFPDLNDKRLKKTLKTLLAREFPRSTKIRLYSLGPFKDGPQAFLPRKRI